MCQVEATAVRVTEQQILGLFQQILVFVGAGRQSAEERQEGKKRGMRMIV